MKKRQKVAAICTPGENVVPLQRETYRVHNARGLRAGFSISPAVADV